MIIALDIDVAPVFITSTFVFLILRCTVEFFFSRAEKTYRVTAVKKGLTWRGFLNPRDAGRVEELRASERRIRLRWILVAVGFTLATYAASFAGEAGISTRIEDRVRGRTNAYSQFGDPVDTHGTTCSSPTTCEPLQAYIQALIRSGDFTLLDFRTSGAERVRSNYSDEDYKVLSTLPKAQPKNQESIARATFQACVQFSFASSDGNVAKDSVIAESCGSVEEKHIVEVFMAEPELSTNDVSEEKNVSSWLKFSEAANKARVERFVELCKVHQQPPVRRMKLDRFLGRYLPKPCEVSWIGYGSGQSGIWLFVCEVDKADLYIGSIKRQTEAPQLLQLNSFHLKTTATGVKLRPEDVMDALALMSPNFTKSGLAGTEGTRFALRSFVYSVMMSTQLREVQTTEPVVLVVLSIPLLVVSAVLLFVPVIIFAAASYLDSRTLSADARHKKLDIPMNASQVHRAAIRAVYPFAEYMTTWTNYGYGLYDPGLPSGKLRLGWTMQPCALEVREVLLV